MSEEIGASLGQSERLDNSLQGGREMSKTYSWRTASLVMALTAIVGLALPALGGEGRPFRGHYVDEMIIEAKPVPDGLQVTTTGPGQATHLGRFTRKGTVVIDLDDGSAEGTAVFTAANGDQLFMEIEGEPTDSPRHHRWHFHVHRGDRPVQRRVGSGGFCGSYCAWGIHVTVAFGGTIQY